MSGSTSNNIIGSGSDSIVLNLSEDQAQGVDAQFTVNVDGQQIGGLQTVTASHSAGQDETFTFLGDFAPGPHNVTVTFANNFLYPGTSGDRNLYVDNVTYDGQTVSNTTTPIYVSPLFPPNSTSGDYFGNAVYSVNDTTPLAGNGSPTTTPGPVAIGSGPDTLVLNMAEDAYNGDAQFTVAVDGQQIGGTQTTSAIVSQGQQQEFDVAGNFGPGNHTVTVTFLNDLIGAFYPAGTPGLPATGGPWAVDTTDRNLYVMGASLDGGAQPSTSAVPWELSGDGSYSFDVTAGSTPGAGVSAASSNTATITPATVAGTTSGSTASSGLTFVAPTTTTTTTASTTTAATTDTTPTVATTVAAATVPTPTVAAATTSATDTTTTASAAGSGHSWWNYHQNTGGGWFHHG
nr:carbohydrate-binding domain-containing protein [uncultured Rhodopila sp.]